MFNDKYSKMSNLVSKLSAGMVNQRLKNVLKKKKKTVAHLAVNVQWQILYMDKPRCGLNKVPESKVALSTFYIMPGTGIRYVGNIFNVLFYCVYKHNYQVMKNLNFMKL